MIPAYKTNIGASKQSYCMLNAKSIKFVGFQVGNGGCRDGQILTVDRNTTTLQDLVSEFGEDDISVELYNSTAIKITCNIRSGTLASNTVSNLGILAKVVGEDSTFLYAISNFSEVPVNGRLSFSIILNN